MAREGSPTDTGLYKAIEKVLKQTKAPMTCVDLYDKSEVRAKAVDANQVSDALGHLWRRDWIKREPAPRTPHNQARWAYYWPTDGINSTPAATAPEPVRSAQRRLPVTVEGENARRVLLAKPQMTITDDGKVVEISLPNFTIRIAAR